MNVRSGVNYDYSPAQARLVAGPFCQDDRHTPRPDYDVRSALH